MSPSPHHQRGVSFVLWLIALFPLLGFATLAVDVNNIFLVRAQVQNAADAGALAGVVKLPDADAARTAAIAVAKANLAQGEVVGLENGDVNPCCWSFATDDKGGKCDCGTAPLNAIEVTTRRDTPIQAFFGKAVGFENYSAEAIARAYASSPSIPEADAAVGRVVLCGPDGFKPNYPAGNATCRLLINGTKNDVCGIGTTLTGCSFRKLAATTALTIGKSVTIKPGNAGTPDYYGLKSVGVESLLPVVGSCPAIVGGAGPGTVTKIVVAKTQLMVGNDPCVIFPDKDPGTGEPNNTHGPARLVY